MLSLIGSFTNLRGGHVYADIVRKSEQKPIRIYLQDGRNDNRGVGRGGTYDQTRDWFFQNVRLMKALTEKGYDLNYPWGIGRHSQKHGGRHPARHAALALARSSGLGRREGHGRALVQHAGGQEDTTKPVARPEGRALQMSDLLFRTSDLR